jgi:hypothetical protein
MIRSTSRTSVTGVCYKVDQFNFVRPFPRAKSLNGSLDVMFSELGNRTSRFASCDIGRHDFEVGTLDVMFFELGHLNWKMNQNK